MGKRIFLSVLVVLVLAALLAYSQLRPRPDEVSGFIEADEIRLGSRVGGRVAEVHCQEGQLVRAGQRLITLEAFDLSERLAEAAAKLRARQAELQRLQHGFREEEIAQAKAHVDQLAAKLKILEKGPRSEEINAGQARFDLASAQRERAQQSYSRMATLFGQEAGAVSREEVDRATEELKVAEQMKEVRHQELQLLLKGSRAEEIQAAEADLEQARQAWLLTTNGYRSEDIAAAAAAAAAAQAAVDALQIQIDELQITCPVDGVVEAVELQPGDLVSPNAPVLSVMDTSHLWVRAYVPENRLDVQIDQQLEITVDSYPNQRFRGRVSFISRQAEFTPNNVQTPEERSKQVFRMKVTLLDGLDRLRPGMAADVSLESG